MQELDDIIKTIEKADLISLPWGRIFAAYDTAANRLGDRAALAAVYELGWRDATNWVGPRKEDKDGQL